VQFAVQLPDELPAGRANGRVAAFDALDVKFSKYLGKKRAFLSRLQADRSPSKVLC